MVNHCLIHHWVHWRFSFFKSFFWATYRESPFVNKPVASNFNLYLSAMCKKKTRYQSLPCSSLSSLANLLLHVLFLATYRESPFVNKPAASNFDLYLSAMCKKTPGYLWVLAREMAHHFMCDTQTPLHISKLS